MVKVIEEMKGGREFNPGLSSITRRIDQDFDDKITDRLKIDRLKMIDWKDTVAERGFFSSTMTKLVGDVWIEK